MDNDGWIKLANTFHWVDAEFGPYKRHAFGWIDPDAVLAAAFESRSVMARGYRAGRCELLSFEPIGLIKVTVSHLNGEVCITKATQPTGSMLPFPKALNFSEVEFKAADLMAYTNRPMS